MPATQEPFVTRVEMAIMQYVILDKAKQGEVTRDNLKQTFRGNLQMSKDHFDHCIQQLVQDGHLKEIGGNKYTVTDDGREDIQKLQHLVLELPNVIQQGGQQGQQRQPQAIGGGSTGSTIGNQGQYGSSKPSGSGAGQQQGSQYPGKTGGSTSGEQRTGDVNKGGSTGTQNR